MVKGLPKKNSVHQLALFSGILGITAFLASLAWQWIGAVPCILCTLERHIFLVGGTLSLLALAFDGQNGQRFLSFSITAWLCLAIVSFRHMGIQEGWFSLPKACKAAIPLMDINKLEAFLSSREQSSCDTIPFTVLGLPPTFFILGVALFLAALCFWGFLKNDEH